MCHAQLVLPLQLHIVLNIPGWWEGELRGPQDVKTTPVWTQTCSNMKHLSRMTEKLAVPNQQITSRQKAGTWISHALPTPRKWKWTVFSRVRTAPACPLPRDLHGRELSPSHSVLCPVLCVPGSARSAEPTHQNQPFQSHWVWAAAIPALNRTRAPSQPEFYRDREKTQLRNSACKSVKYGSMKGCK